MVFNPISNSELPRSPLIISSEVWDSEKNKLKEK